MARELKYSILAHDRMNKKIDNMSDDELKKVWDALQTQEWRKGDTWDWRGHVSMDTWAESIYSEISRRGLI